MRPEAFDSFTGAEKLVTLGDDLIQSYADQFEWNEVSDQIHRVKIVSYGDMDSLDDEFNLRFGMQSGPVR